MGMRYLMAYAFYFSSCIFTKRYDYYKSNCTLLLHIILAEQLLNR